MVLGEGIILFIYWTYVAVITHYGIELEILKM